jgi:hypothetical protein
LECAGTPVWQIASVGSPTVPPIVPAIDCTLKSCGLNIKHSEKRSRRYDPSRLAKYR